jgi:hypothetical protein
MPPPDHIEVTILTSAVAAVDLADSAEVVDLAVSEVVDLAAVEPEEVGKTDRIKNGKQLINIDIAK